MVASRRSRQCPAFHPVLFVCLIGVHCRRRSAMRWRGGSHVGPMRRVPAPSAKRCEAWWAACSDGPTRCSSQLACRFSRGAGAEGNFCHVTCIYPVPACLPMARGSPCGASCPHGLATLPPPSPASSRTRRACGDGRSVAAGHRDLALRDSCGDPVARGREVGAVVKVWFEIAFEGDINA